MTPEEFRQHAHELVDWMADYLRDVGETNLVGSVHIEAVWDRTRDPVEETEWLDGLDKPRGVAARCIAARSGGTISRRSTSFTPAARVTSADSTDTVSLHWSSSGASRP